MIGWHDPETAAYYEAFCRRRSRYARANAALVAHACIAPGMCLLDFAAGTGRTAEAALRRLGESGRVSCVEPFLGMRTEGMRRVRDSRVRWSPALPRAGETFDRILCGAAIWQMEPLRETFSTLAALLRPGGALCFNIPAAYLLEPEEPGGGSDPSLLSLPAMLAALSEHAPAPETPDPSASSPLTRDAIDASLIALGLSAEVWSFRVRVTQDGYADWLKIPVLTNRLFGVADSHARARLIDSALATADRTSWKYEPWRGWTAWKK